MNEIGKVTHYYDKVGVAIIKLSGALRVGDKIKIADKSEEFEQAVESMEIDRKKVENAGAGDEIGVKVDQKAKEGAAVSKID